MLNGTKHDLRIESESGYKTEEIDLLEIAAHFFLKELAKLKPFDTIHGKVIVVNDLKSEAASEPLNGDMAEIKDFYLDNGERVNYYVCRLADYANSAETMRTLAHELIHVWQTATGRLQTSEDNGWYWRGKSYGHTPYSGTDSDYDLPWEREADKLDLQLTKKFYKTYFTN